MSGPERALAPDIGGDPPSRAGHRGGDGRRSRHRAGIVGRATGRFDQWCTRVSTSPRWWLAVLGLVVVHLVLSGFRARTGMAVTTDGFDYIDRALAFEGGNLALDPGGSRAEGGFGSGPLHHAPLYSAWMALGGWATGWRVTTIAAAINVVAITAAAFGLDRLVREAMRGRPSPGPWPFLVVALAVLSAPATIATAQVLAGPAFFACWIWMAVALIRFARTEHPGWLAGAVVAGLGAVSLRWVGVFLVLGGTVFLAAWRLRDRRPPLAAAAFLGAATAPIALWVAWARTFEPSAATSHGRTGVLGGPTTLVESLSALGSRALGLLQGRVGGVQGRGEFSLLPGPARGPAFVVSVVVGTALLAAALVIAVTLLRRLVSPTGDPSTSIALLAILVPVAVYGLGLYLTRAVMGYFVLPRYWGLVPVLVAVAVVVHLDEGSERPRRAVLSSLMGGLVLVNLTGLAILTANAL